MKKQIPQFLIYTRLVFGFLILGLAFVKPLPYESVVTVLLTLGLLTDILDGIVARHLQVSSQTLRRLDSNVDQIFFICVAISTWWHCPDFFKANWIAIGLLLFAEAFTYLVSYLKFRKEIATHSIGAKLWTLILFATLIQLVWQCQSTWIFQTCIVFGLITRLEIVLIILTLREWTNDVPSIYHAIRLRQGKPISRNKLFNG